MIMDFNKLALFVFGFDCLKYSVAPFWMQKKLVLNGFLSLIS